MSSERLKLRCDFCSPIKRGYLWMGGGDWVECPQCETKGTFDVIEERHEPTGRTFIYGSTQGFAVNRVWSRRF